MHSRTRWVVLGILSSALLLIVIDMTVLYTALPRLTHDLHASASEKLWIVNAYALAVAGLLPGMGALGDRFGAKKLFASGLVVFGGASLLAAFSPNPEVLIAARIILAVGAAMMMPATLSIIRQIFEEPNERALAIGVWAAVASGGAAFGPVVGGVLLEYYWWGSVFLINVPIVVVAFVFTLVLIPRSTSNPDRLFDLWASVQILIGLVGVTYAVKEISKPSPSVEAVLVVGTLGVLFMALFVRRQRRSPTPMIDFNLFRNHGFTAAVMTALVASAALIGLEFAISQRFQLALGLSPLQAGLLIVPIPLAAFIAGPLAGIVIPKLGSVRLLWASLAVAGFGVFGYLAGLQAGLYAQIASFVMIGVGLGAAMTAASTSIMHSAPAHSAGVAASIEEVSYELGGAIGIAILGSLMTAVYSGAFDPPAGVAVAELAHDSLDAALVAAERLSGDTAAMLIQAAERAFHSAFLTVLVVAAALLLTTSAGIALSERRRNS